LQARHGSCLRTGAAANIAVTAPETIREFDVQISPHDAALGRITPAGSDRDHSVRAEVQLPIPEFLCRTLPPVPRLAGARLWSTPNRFTARGGVDKLARVPDHFTV
jgi:hypothetical protein